MPNPHAIDKIRDEMAKNHDNPAICAIGDIVTRLLQANPAAGTAVAAKGKTLAGAYDAMRDHARTHKKGDCYYMPPAEAERIIRAYFGIPAAPDAAPIDLDAMVGEAPASSAPYRRASPATESPDPFDLDALLGEV